MMMTKYRSLSILISYLALAASLQLNACRTIYRRYRARQLRNDWSTPQRAGQFLVFAVLAALSLGATWYYMFAFFAHSYRNWESSQGIQGIRELLDLPLGSKVELWLRNTKLFREAWETVIETPARFWWSGQIFLWTTGWSVFLGIMARRYRIPHVWAYMLLGQIVAVSFAHNLFFATILVSRQLPSVPKSSDAGDNNDDDHRRAIMAWTPPLSLEVVPVAVSLLSTALVPFVAHTRYFMLVLLIPHLLLFVPAILRPSRSFGGGGNASKDSRQNTDGADASTRRYVVFFKWFLGICVLLQAHATYAVISDIPVPDVTTASYGALARRLLAAMYEHPAVSSVSWDVVFCTVGTIAWAAVHGGDMSRMLGGTQTRNPVEGTGG